MPVVQIAQRLQTAGGGTGADTDQITGRAAHPVDPLHLLPGGQAALHKGDQYRRIRIIKPRFQKVADLYPLAQLEQLFAQIQKRQLTAVAGAELVYGDGGQRLSGSHHSPRMPSSSRTAG